MATVAAKEVKQSASRYLNTAVEIEERFKVFRDERTPLTLTMDEDGQQVTATVLDVTSRSILIEDIKPRTALGLLKKHPKFSISVRAEGSFAFVDNTSISGEGEERGLPYFHVPLPTSMVYQQRRSATRVRLPLQITSRGAYITLFAAPEVTGQIVDISAGGCRVNFAVEQCAQFEIDDSVKQGAICLPPRVELHSDCVIRHWRKQPDGSLTVGLEFIAMHITDRRRLEQFIQSASRAKV